MNELMGVINQISGGEPENIIYHLQSVMQNNRTAMIAGIVIGLIICFFGLKLIRILAALAGAVAGAMLGLAAGAAAGLENAALLIAVAGAAAVVACLSAVLYRVGVFVWMLTLGTGAALMTFTSESPLTALVCVGVGLILAIVTTIFLDPIIIIISAIVGGFSAGISIAEMAGFDGNILMTVLGSLLLAALGLVIQFMMKSREVGKKERLYSESFREKESMETEVERARMLLDDDAGKTAAPEEKDSSDEEDEDLTFVE